MDKAKRAVGCTPRDFLAAWGRGDAGLVPCGACTACCHYPGIVVDEKRDRRRLAHLLTERSPNGELVSAGCLGLVIGFLAGYAVRADISRRRRRDRYR